MKHRYHINLLIDSELDIDKVKELFEINCGTVERIKLFEFTSKEGKIELPKTLYCDECKRITNHRIKLGSIQQGCLVCNECNTMNNKDD